MIQNLSELKRKLIVGTPIKSIYNRLGNKNVGIQRYVIKTQGNGVYLSENKESKKGSFLEFPKASLIEFTENGFKIFESGVRDLTKEEQECIDNEPKDEEQENIDLMSDTNVMFYKRQLYYKNSKFPYLGSSTKAIRGKYFLVGERKIRDDNIKGELSIEYEITK